MGKFVGRAKRSSASGPGAPETNSRPGTKRFGLAPGFNRAGRSASVLEAAAWDWASGLFLSVLKLKKRFRLRRALIGLGEALPFASRGECGRCPNEALGVLAKPAPGKGLILQIFEAALFARGNRVAGRDGALEPVAGLLKIPGHPPAGGIEPG